MVSNLDIKINIDEKTIKETRKILKYFLNKIQKLFCFVIKEIDKLLEKRLYFRVATKNEIDIIVNAAKKSYGCRINNATKKLTWFNKNNQIYWVVTDKKNNIYCNLDVLPITEKCFENLKYGKINENDIAINDIIRLKMKEKVKYLYIEGFNCESWRFIENGKFCKYKKYALKAELKAIDNFIKIVHTLSDFSSDIVICAINGSNNGKRLMEGLNFEIIGHTKDGSEFLKYRYSITKIRNDINNYIKYRKNTY